MKPDKDHIGLETAKLLKDCEVDSRFIFNKYGEIDSRIDDLTPIDVLYPAYTWEEIEDNAEKFFDMENKESYWEKGKCYELSKMKLFIEKKKYEEADLYFRENNIF